MLNKITNSLLVGLLLVGCNGCTLETSKNSDSGETASNEHHDHDHDHAGHDHEHTDHQEQMTFEAAVEKLVSMGDTIKQGFASGDTGAAHGPLHQVGHVLETISKLADAEDLSSEQLLAVKAATEKLFDAYGNIDKTMHGGEGSTYEDEADGIQEAMIALKEAAGLAGG